MNIHSVGPVAATPERSTAHKTSLAKTPIAYKSASKALEGASLPSLPPLTSETQAHVAAATQETAPERKYARHVPPSQQARAAILANPALADQPFGQIVSRIARGEPLLASDSLPPANAESPSDPPSIHIRQSWT